MNNFTQSDIERFSSKVNKLPNGCWIWTAQRSDDGYGRFMITTNTGRKNYLAHRFSYMIHYGEIPQGFEVCHTCDVPSCVRPDHLFLGTHLENCQDRTAKNRNRFFSGERNGQHKLTASQVMRIRELELPPEIISKKFKISITQTKRLRAFQQWKWLPQQQRFSFIEGTTMNNLTSRITKLEEEVASFSDRPIIVHTEAELIKAKKTHHGIIIFDNIPDDDSPEEMKRQYNERVALMELPEYIRPEDPKYSLS
jgi:hypothetical protein